MEVIGPGQGRAVESATMPPLWSAGGRLRPRYRSTPGLSDSPLVVAIVGGLGAALCWAIATLASSRSSRMIGAFSVLAWVMVVGLAVSIVPAVLATPVPLGPTELIELV